jgi:hypothetical protein
MAVVTRDSTQGWQGKGLFVGTTEDRHFLWAGRRACLLYERVNGSTYTGWQPRLLSCLVKYTRFKTASVAAGAYAPEISVSRSYARLVRLFHLDEDWQPADPSSWL